MKNLKLLIPLKFKGYKEKLIPELEQSLKKIQNPKYKKKVDGYICEIQRYIEDIRKIVLEITKDTTKKDFETKLSNLDKIINEVYQDIQYTANKDANKDAIKEANKSLSSDGGSLIYYKKYLKYKSKYLQIK